jgi:hypothetical protein
MNFFLGYDKVKGETNEGDSPSSKKLLNAILKNKVCDVRKQLEHGVDPNTSLAIGPSGSISNDRLSEDRLLSLEKAFLWKKIFGEAPSLIHVGVLNVYHRQDKNSEIDRALKILDLLIDYGGDVSQCSLNIFMRRSDDNIVSNPLDLAMGVQRMCTWMNMETTEAAMTKAVAVLKKERDQKRILKTNRIPIELVSLPLVDVAKDFMFLAKENTDVVFLFSDGGPLREADPSIRKAHSY